MPTDPHNTADRTPHRNTVLMQLREMQDVAHALSVNKDTEPQHVAQLIRAYVEAEKQRNVLRMRPAPKPIEVGLDGKPLKAGRKRGSISRSDGAISDAEPVSEPGPERPADTSVTD